MIKRDPKLSNLMEKIEKVDKIHLSIYFDFFDLLIDLFDRLMDFFNHLIDLFNLLIDI